MYNALLVYFSSLILLAIILLFFAPKLHIKKPMRFLSIILFLIILPAVIGYIFLTYIAPLPETVVPDVIGLNENEAIIRIERLGLDAKIALRENSSDIVTGQRPEAGKIVKIGRVVFVDLGKQGRDTPYPPAVIMFPLLTSEAATSEINIEVVTSEGVTR